MNQQYVIQLNGTERRYDGASQLFREARFRHSVYPTEESALRRVAEDELTNVTVALVNRK